MLFSCMKAFFVSPSPAGKSSSFLAWYTQLFMPQPSHPPALNDSSLQHTHLMFWWEQIPFYYWNESFPFLFPFLYAFIYTVPEYAPLHKSSGWMSNLQMKLRHRFLSEALVDNFLSVRLEYCPPSSVPPMLLATNRAQLGIYWSSFLQVFFFFLTELGGPGGQGSRHHYKPKTSTDLAQVLSKQLKLNKCLWLK